MFRKHITGKTFCLITLYAQLELHGFSFITSGQAISPAYFFPIDWQNFNLFRPFALEEGRGLLFFFSIYGI